MSQEAVQQKYLELQILEQQIQQLQHQAQILQQQHQELLALKEAIQEISKVKENSESLIPLGAGVYIKGEIKDTKNIIMNVGANVTTEKTTKEALDIVEEQITHVQNLLERLSSDLEKTTTSAQQSQMEIQATMASHK